MVALAAGVDAGPLQTFSIGFREEAFSELPYARQVAERFGTRHVEEIVTPDAVDAARRADPLLRRAVRRLVGDPDVPGLAAGAPERQGGALGRRRRRGVRRLRPLRPRPEGGGAARAGCPAGCGGRAGAAGPGLAQGRLAAAAAAGQDAADEPVAGRRPTPTPTRCPCAGCRCGGGCWPPDLVGRAQRPRPGARSSATATRRPGRTTPWAG